MQHLLFLVHRIPYPPNKGDKVRSYNVLKYLAARFRVHLGAFVDDEADLQYADVLSDMCEECHLVRLRPGLAKIKSLAGLITGEALTLPYYRNANMQAWVSRVLHEAPVQSVLAFSSAMAQYVMSEDGMALVADLVDVDSDKWRQYAATQSWPYSAIYRREGRKLLEYERSVAREFDATVFVSTAEAELFRQLAPDSANKVWHVNNGVDSDYFSPEFPYENPYGADKCVLVFTGAMDYWPNIDAVQRFASVVFPQILGQFREAKFYIVGARPAPEVTALAGLPGVKVTGAVPDIRPYLAHARVAVAPLRLARGVQNKVLEAMAMGKPVVASSQAAEGIEARHGHELLVASDEGEFVRQVMGLIQHDSDKIGSLARERVLVSYAWQNSLSRLEQLLAGTISDSLSRDKTLHDESGCSLRLTGDLRSLS